MKLFIYEYDTILLALAFFQSFVGLGCPGLLYYVYKKELPILINVQKSQIKVNTYRLFHIFFQYLTLETMRKISFCLLFFFFLFVFSFSDQPVPLPWHRCEWKMSEKKRLNTLPPHKTYYWNEGVASGSGLFPFTFFSHFSNLDSDEEKYNQLKQ